MGLFEAWPLSRRVTGNVRAAEWFCFCSTPPSLIVNADDCSTANPHKNQALSGLEHGRFVIQVFKWILDWRYRRAGRLDSSASSSSLPTQVDTMCYFEHGRQAGDDVEFATKANVSQAPDLFFSFYGAVV